MLLVCKRQSLASRSKEVIPLLLSPAERFLECWVQSLGSPVQGRHGHTLEEVQQRVTKVMKWPELLSSVKRLGEIGPVSLERRRIKGGIFLACINIWREGVKQTEPGSPQWSPVAGPEAMNTNWKRWGSVRVSGNTSLLWEWPNTSAGCSERVWSFYPWRYSRASWT